MLFIAESTTADSSKPRWTEKPIDHSVDFYCLVLSGRAACSCISHVFFSFHCTGLMKEPSLLWYGALFEWHIPCCSALHCCCCPKFPSHPKDRALTWEVLGGVPCAMGIHQSLPCWSITKSDFAFIMRRHWGFIPTRLCCQVLEWVLQIPWSDIRWKKTKEETVA